MGPLLHNAFLKTVKSILVASMVSILLISSYVYVDKILGEKVYTIDVPQNLEELKHNLVENTEGNKGLRSVKINARYELPQNIISEEEYKDVKLISTRERPFSKEEIEEIKVVIDMMPQKLFDYRPWAIASISFQDSSVVDVNPDGVAFSSGPYVYVGDVTFKKQASYDTGTFRGLERILAHEFTHTAQFFETKTIPKDFTDSYLEQSNIVIDWAEKTGWTKSGGKWVLKQNEETTEYGTTNPVEDMADSVGSMVIAEESALSNDRASWVLNWLGLPEEELFMGTIPTNSNIKQRRIENDDNRLLQKFFDPKAVSQDVMNFQSTQTVSKKDLANYYASEFKKRGWSGSINTLGTGEFIYLNKYKVNMEMDNNPLRVVTMITTVF